MFAVAGHSAAPGPCEAASEDERRWLRAASCAEEFGSQRQYQVIAVAVWEATETAAHQVTAITRRLSGSPDGAQATPVVIATELT